MISDIRKQFKGAGFQTIIMISVFALIGPAFYFGLFKSRDGAIGVINGDSIDRLDYVIRVHAKQQQIQSIQEQYGKHAELIMRIYGINPQPEVAAQISLVQEILLAQVAHELPVVLGREVGERIYTPHVLQELTGLRLPHGEPNAALVQRALGSIGLTVSRYEDMADRALLGEQALRLARVCTPLTRADEREEYIKLHGERSFTINSYSIADYVQEKGEKPSPEELKKFFVAQQNEQHAYWHPQKRNVDLYKISLKGMSEDKRKDLLDELNRMTVERVAKLRWEQWVKDHKGVLEALSEVTKDDNNGLHRQIFENMTGEWFFYHDTEKREALFVGTVTKIIPESKKTFEEAQKAAQADFIKQRAREAIMGDLNKEKNDLKPSKTENILLTSTDSSELDRYVARGLDKQQLLNLTTVGSRVIIPTADTIYRAKLTAVSGLENVSLTLEEKIRLLDSQSRLLLEAFVETIHKNAKISFN